MNTVQIAAQSIFVLMLPAFPKSIALLVLRVLQQAISGIVGSAGRHSRKIQDVVIVQVGLAKTPVWSQLLQPEGGSL